MGWCLGYVCVLVKSVEVDEKVFYNFSSATENESMTIN